MLNVDTTAAENLLKEISWLFQINGYEKNVCFVKHASEDHSAAEITIDVSYQTIELKLFPAFFTYDINWQRKTLLHELCHTITGPAKLAMHNALDGKLVPPDRIKQINEEATSRIENILHGLMTNNLTYAKKAYANYLKPKKKGKKKHG